ncbi:hypothetical protein [Streptomyces sp. NWU339]|uniref:hypothetical protein n=1 Tax=Streptomyces sp. NWU339 TaxID=2185284 RepID=UPI0015E82B04|nr:hypothetical protein [Streptomyces sp. NWU339]
MRAARKHGLAPWVNAAEGTCTDAETGQWTALAPLSPYSRHPVPQRGRALPYRPELPAEQPRAGRPLPAEYFTFLCPIVEHMVRSAPQDAASLAATVKEFRETGAE